MASNVPADDQDQLESLAFTFVVGDIFKTYEALERKLEEYKKTHYVEFCKRLLRQLAVECLIDTQYERFRKASLITTELASVASEAFNIHFEQKLSSLNDLLKYWKNGKEVAIHEVTSDDENFVDSPDNEVNNQESSASIILLWFVDEQVVRQVLQDNSFIEEYKVECRPEKIPSPVLDEM
uniref:Uncharacterized protein n=1 Tax=Amphimedon queenslandica TaxID=400682 RepID=A0A1X7UD11_AMPQE